MTALCMIRMVHATTKVDDLVVIKFIAILYENMLYTILHISNLIPALIDIYIVFAM